MAQRPVGPAEPSSLPPHSLGPVLPVSPAYSPAAAPAALSPTGQQQDSAAQEASPPPFRPLSKQASLRHSPPCLTDRPGPPVSTVIKLSSCSTRTLSRSPCPALLRRPLVLCPTAAQALNREPPRPCHPPPIPRASRAISLFRFKPQRRWRSAAVAPPLHRCSELLSGLPTVVRMPQVPVLPAFSSPVPLFTLDGASLDTRAARSCTPHLRRVPSPDLNQYPHQVHRFP